MARNALGFIETFGLVGAIEAADAAAKTASVRLIKSEVTQPALVTVQIEGELGAVQAAVEAGVEACKRIGQVWAHVIIPRPDTGLDVMLETPSSLLVPRGPFRAVSPEPKGSGPNSLTETFADSPAQKRASRRPENSRQGSRGGYESMTVVALRRMARRRLDLPIAGRDIARADKETLTRLLNAADSKPGND